MKIAGLAKIITYVPITIEAKTLDEAENRIELLEGEIIEDEPEFKDININEFESHIEMIFTKEDI